MSVSGHLDLLVSKTSFLVPVNVDIGNMSASIEGLQIENVTSAYEVDAVGFWALVLRLRWGES